MVTRRGITMAVAMALLVAPGGCDSHDERAAQVDGGHLDEDHAGEATRDGVALTTDQRERAGLRTAPARPVVLSLDSSFPGEVCLVPDRVIHVVAQAPGIVRETRKTIGDRVEAGEVLATIESSELSAAKLQFFAAASEVGCCQIALPRAKEIHENVIALLEVLDQGADSEAIARLHGKEMGDWRGRLLSARAALDAARAALERERILRERKVTSETALVDAVAAYARSQAQLDAEKDTARYTTLVDYREEARKRQIAELALAAAENRLRVLGVEEAQIERLRQFVPKASSFEPCTCSDPDCEEGQIPSILEALAGEPELGLYRVRAHQEGVIIEKHLSLGERVSGEEAAFKIVSTDRVWVRFNVYQKELDRVRVGVPVLVQAQGMGEARAGAVAYVSPVVDERTRTVAARVELDNPEGLLRPGLFAAVTVASAANEAAVAVPAAAVQVLDEHEVVFVEREGSFVPLKVQTGRRDRDHVEILSGLEAGSQVVVDGAFDLKAEIVTSGLGSHAGHGH